MVRRIMGSLSKAHVKRSGKRIAKLEAQAKRCRDDRNQAINFGAERQTEQASTKCLGLALMCRGAEGCLNSPMPGFVLWFRLFWLV